MTSSPAVRDRGWLSLFIVRLYLNNVAVSPEFNSILAGLLDLYTAMIDNPSAQSAPELVRSHRLMAFWALEQHLQRLEQKLKWGESWSRDERNILRLLDCMSEDFLKAEPVADYAPAMAALPSVLYRHFLFLSRERASEIAAEIRTQLETVRAMNDAA